MDLAAFDSAHIQNIIDQRQQMVAGGKDLVQIVPHPFLILHIAGCQCGKSDNGVHGRADIMRHIGEECALGTVGGLRSANRLRKRLIDLFIGSPIRHDQYVLSYSLHIAAHRNDMEPAPFSGFPVDIFKVPFTLLVRCQPLQILFDLLCGLLWVQLRQNMCILPDLFRCDAQQLPRIGAGIIRLRCFGVQHQKYIVHIHRELSEQLLPIQNLGVLLPQVHAAPTQN